MSDLPPDEGVKPPVLNETLPVDVHTWWARRYRVDPNNVDQIAAFVAAGEHLNAIWWAIQRLQDIGTPAAVPALKKAVYYRRWDIKLDALDAIARIEGARGCPYYIELLYDTKYPAKENAIVVITRHCGEDGVPHVAKRVVAVLTRGRRSVSWWHAFTQTEVTLALAYLERYGRGRPEVDKAVAKAKEKWMDLRPQERRVLVGLSSFAEMPAPAPSEGTL